MCGPHRRFAPLLPRTLRRIPQAVGVFATYPGCKAWFLLSTYVSIPQAVGVFATGEKVAIPIYR